METPFLLRNGRNSGYGLGMDVTRKEGHFALEHSGEVGGFVAENLVLPDDKSAIVVLTNQEASSAASQIAEALLPLVLAGENRPATPADKTAQAFLPELKTTMTGLAGNHLEQQLFTPDALAYFRDGALADFHTSLAPLGTIQSVDLVRSALRGGMTFALCRVTYANGTKLDVTVYLTPEGKIEQLLVVGRE